jgi:hypothetical protein
MAAPIWGSFNPYFDGDLITEENIMYQPQGRCKWNTYKMICNKLLILWFVEERASN